MSGWIKFEKDLRTDPRVLRMARAIGERFVLFERDCNAPPLQTFEACNASPLHAVTVVLGALAQLWSLADSHAESDVLYMSEGELDEYLGISGFCALMPHDWLQVLDDGSIELPGFQAHNGPDAKARAVTQKRVERHRTRNAPPLHAPHSRNAPPLPDKTRPDKTRLDQTHTQSARAIALDNKPQAAAPAPNLYGAMSLALRGVGVTINSIHPVLIAWADDGFTVDQLLGAVAIARETKGDNERLPPNYLDTILRAPPRHNGNGSRPTGRPGGPMTHERVMAELDRATDWSQPEFPDEANA